MFMDFDSKAREKREKEKNRFAVFWGQTVGLILKKNLLYHIT